MACVRRSGGFGVAGPSRLRLRGSALLVRAKCEMLRGTSSFVFVRRVVVCLLNYF